MAAMFTLTRPSVTFYVHCLSCLKFRKSVTICTVLLLLTSGIVSSYPPQGKDICLCCPVYIRGFAVGWIRVQGFLWPACKQDSSSGNPDTPELHWSLAMYKKKSVLDFRLYNQRWGMKLGNKVHVCWFVGLFVFLYWKKNALPAVSVALHLVQL